MLERTFKSNCPILYRIEATPETPGGYVVGDVTILACELVRNNSSGSAWVPVLPEPPVTFSFSVVLIKNVTNVDTIKVFIVIGSHRVFTDLSVYSVDGPGIVVQCSPDRIKRSHSCIFTCK